VEEPGPPDSLPIHRGDQGGHIQLLALIHQAAKALAEERRAQSISVAEALEGDRGERHIDKMAKISSSEAKIELPGLEWIGQVSSAQRRTSGAGVNAKAAA
jgi:hypothetical protein